MKAQSVSQWKTFHRQKYVCWAKKTLKSLHPDKIDFVEIQRFFHHPIKYLL